MFSPGKLGGGTSIQSAPSNYFPPAPPLEGFNPLGLNIDQRDAIVNASNAMSRDNQMQAPQPTPFPTGPAAYGEQLLQMLATMRGRR